MKHISPFILSETYLLPSSITSRNHVRRAPTHPCQPYLRRIRTKTFHIFPCLPASNKTRISPFYRIEIIKQSQIQTLTKYDMIFSFLYRLLGDTRYINTRGKAAFRNALGICPSESFWNRHIIPEREIYPPPVESCYRVALTLQRCGGRRRACAIADGV